MSVPICTQPNLSAFYNSLGQSPCYVATALGNACNVGGAVFTLPSLNSSDPWYPGPSVANTDNICQCSTVYYSMLSACSTCQTSVWNTWTGHSKNCTSTAISLSSFPKPIPAGTSVPHYAYLDVVADNIFNATLALVVGGAESSPVSSISSTTSTQGTVSAGSSTAFSTSAFTTSTDSRIESSTESTKQPALTSNPPISSATSTVSTGSSTTKASAVESDTAKGRSIMIGAIVGPSVGFFLLVLVVGSIWLCKSLRKRAMPVQNLPTDSHLLQNMEQQSGDQYSVAQYSLLGTPTRPPPLEITSEDVK